MHILHFITSLEVGGAQRALLTLIANDTSATHEVAYVHEGPYIQKLQALGIRVTRINGFFSAYEPTTIVRLWQLVRRCQPAVIHTSLWLAGVIGRLVGRLTGVAVLCDLHSNATHHGAFRNSVDRLTFRGATYCAVSASVGAVFCSKMHTKRKITTVANGVDQAGIYAAGMAYHYTRAQFGIDNEAFVLGTVGRLVAIKRYEHLLLCHYYLQQKEPAKKIVTCIVGNGPEMAALQEQAHELGIANDVRFFGYRDDVYGLYPLFDCFVMTSQSEGLSYALLEALCFGLPVVVSHDTHTHDVIKNNENGAVVVAALNGKGLVDPIHNYLNNPELTKRIKDKNIALVNGFYAPSIMVAQYHLLYKRVTARQQVDE